MKYSIIIPVYRSQNTIINCIEGILKEAKDTEVIVVSDDSDERDFLETCDIIKAYIENNSVDIPLHIIRNSKSKGVSGARNTGLEASAGEYIWFVDSDDQVKQGWYEAWEKTTIQKPDIAIAGYEEWDEDTLRITRYCASSLTYMDKKEFVGSSLQHLQEEWLVNAVWNKLFKRACLKENHVYFPEDGTMGEDLVFSLHAIEQATSITLSDEVIYRYIHYQKHRSACDIFHENALMMTLEAYETERRIYKTENIQMPDSIEQFYIEAIEAYIRDLVVLNSGKWRQYRESVRMVSRIMDTKSFGLVKFMRYRYTRFKRLLSWVKHGRIT